MVETQLTLLCMSVAIYYLLKVWDRVIALRSKHGSPDQSLTTPSRVHTAPILAPAEMGPGYAAANPPEGVDMTLRVLEQRTTNDRLELPLGWYVDPDNHLDVAVFSLDGRSKFGINHTLISGQTRSGKDNLAILWALMLTNRNTPDQVQICAIDGKGLDWAPWKRKAHGWKVAIQPEEIPAVMTAITQERQRRAALLLEEGERKQGTVSKWENSQLGLPLLWVFISELALLESALGSSKALDQWLNAELAAGAAFGIRFCIATQDAANFGTRWRRQITLHLSGYQPSATADQPNTGSSTADILQRGAVPPSQLPPPPSGSGYFCAVTGAEAMNIRAPYLSDEERARALAMLPQRTMSLHQHADATAMPVTAVGPHVQQSNLDLLHLLVTNQPLPFADRDDALVGDTPVMKQEPLLPEIIKTKTLGDLEKDSLFVTTVRDTYARLGTVRQVVIEIFGTYTGSRDQTVTRVLRTTGDIPERAASAA